jgi:hypothetical protein
MLNAVPATCVPIAPPPNFSTRKLFNVPCVQVTEAALLIATVLIVPVSDAVPVNVEVKLAVYVPSALSVTEEIVPRDVLMTTVPALATRLTESLSFS